MDLIVLRLGTRAAQPSRIVLSRPRSVEEWCRWTGIFHHARTHQPRPDGLHAKDKGDEHPDPDALRL